MYKKCIIYIMQLVVVTSTIVSLNDMTTESSEDYLRKVMIELQEMKMPPSSVAVYSHKNFPAAKRLSQSHSDSLSTGFYHKNIPKQMDILKTSATDDHQQYHHHHNQQFSAPIVVPEPSKIHGESVGFTRNQLATIYKQALQSGNTMSLSTLKNALDTGHSPLIVDNELQLPLQQQQMYTYHFYPLQSFVETLQDNNGYKTINNLIEHPQKIEQASNKQIIINPLFMAVSSFIGMSLLFMFGVIFLPRIFGEFKSRVVGDEFINLTTTVTEAIDNYNLTTKRPKTRFSGAVVGIKTRPVMGVGGTTRRRRKTQQSSEKRMW